MYRDSVPFVFLPVVDGDFVWCHVHPVAPTDVWPPKSQDLDVEYAVPLELHPDSRSGRDPQWESFADLPWPEDCRRIAVSLGHQAVITSAGLPIAAKTLLDLLGGHFWQYATLAFVRTGSQPSPQTVWRALQTQVLNSLYPSDWVIPSELHTVLHVASGDAAWLISRSHQTLELWFRERLVRAFPVLAPLLQQSSTHGEALSISLLRKAYVRGGGQIHSVRLEGDRLTVEGRWGIGRGRRLRAGTIRGPSFRATWCIPDENGRAQGGESGS